MIEINAEKALALLEECVEERGEGYVYGKQGGDCLYVHGAVVEEWDAVCEEYVLLDETDLTNATPGCMVGLALIKAGVPMETFLDLSINRESSGEALGALLSASVALATRRAEDIFAYAQTAQDAGRTWGEALKIARTVR